MIQQEPNAQFWENRWTNREIGWDLGEVSPPIKEYIGQYKNKNHRILIPGCGNAHEAEYLINEGFTDITLIDISPTATAILQEKFTDSPQVKIVCEDFFEHNGEYDLILEQTFFCAISPTLRKKYVEKMRSLLSEEGKLVGVLFNVEFEKQGPPFGGFQSDYQSLFEKHFDFKSFEPCYNSALPRADSELFIILKFR
jgi:SAM-dependent methyltransferase